MINNKHKQINTNEKISIAMRLSKKTNPVFLRWVSLNITNITKNIIIKRSLNFGANLIFKSSIRPKIKKNALNIVEGVSKLKEWSNSL